MLFKNGEFSKQFSTLEELSRWIATYIAPSNKPTIYCSKEEYVVFEKKKRWRDVKVIVR